MWLWSVYSLVGGRVSLWGCTLRVSMLRILSSVSVHFLLPARPKTLSYFSSTTSACTEPCPTMMIMDWTTELWVIPIKYFLCKSCHGQCLFTATETLRHQSLLLFSSFLFPQSSLSCQHVGIHPSYILVLYYCFCVTFLLWLWFLLHLFSGYFWDNVGLADLVFTHYIDHSGLNIRHLILSLPQ